MRRRWRWLAAALLLVAAVPAVPVIAIEAGCRPARAGAAAPAAPALTADPQRQLVRTWLTYPEWHIVYSAESLGRWLAAGGRPSGYAYGGDVAGFWRSYCAINRGHGELPGTGEAKLMIYTIGISFTAEMAVKAAWEQTFGVLSETLGGWTTPEDRYAAQTQAAYGAFMHEVPWYRFPFAKVLGGLWRQHGAWSWVRRPERRVALSAEYGVKALYAKALGGASDSMGLDRRTLRMVIAAPAARVRAVDPRLRVVARARAGTIVEAPRYAQFTELVGRLAAAGVPIREIAGNRTIFVTVRAPAGFERGALLAMPLGDRPGWMRYGVTLPVPALTGWIAAARARGAEIEHVYDY